MRKLLITTLLLVLGTSATALADHDRDRHDRHDRNDRNHDRRGYVQRDHRWTNHARPVVIRDRHARARNHHRPIYINSGRYTFHDGRSFAYRRPAINVRYTDYRYRPTLLVENYDNVPGYVWVAGSWQWNGYEWSWVAGHYAVDPSYGNGYIGDYSYAPVASGHDCD